MLVRVLIVVIVGTSVCTPAFASSDGGSLPVIAQPDLTPNARAAMLMSDTGQIVYAKNADEPLPPASITKIMTMLLVMEAIARKQLTWTERVRTSERAASMGGSQIFLQPGEQMAVSDLLKGVAMASANDAAVALAERIAGSEAGFVAQMNERAAQLGMRNTRFQNVNGLPVADHYTSASDIARMSRALLAHKEVLTYTRAYEDYLRRDTPKPFWLVNTNKLVRVYDGADGLKTGYTQEAQFCLAATAQRNGLRWIAVVLGAPSTKIRNSEVAALFDYGFARFEQRTVAVAGQRLGTVAIEGSAQRDVVITAVHPLTMLVPRNTPQAQSSVTMRIQPSLRAPIAAGARIGDLVIGYGSLPPVTHPLYAPYAIRAATFWTRWRDVPRLLFE
jgi:D-alanyl-D-alanine carboxypeptidase (penicillin-binding protein 5/6)